MIRIRFPFDDFANKLNAVQRVLASDRRTLLETLGVQLLSFVQIAYVTKARGGTGEDGISWKDVTRETIEARVRSRAPAKRIVEQRRELAARIKVVKSSRAGTGVGKAAWIKAEVAKLQKQRANLLDKLNAMIDAEMANHEIGVDLGLQRASAQPGFMAPDGKGGNALEVDQLGVTVGFARSYSEYFDAQRKLLPETLPASWLEALEGHASEWGAEILGREM